MSLDKMFENFKDVSEFQAFAQAQYKTILELSKKNKLLEEQNSNLKKMLEDSTPLIKNEEQKEDNKEYEKNICEKQLKLLRDKSFEGELTLEEAKRVEIFAKILMQLNNKSKLPEKNDKPIDTKELLRIVEGGLSVDGESK